MINWIPATAENIEKYLENGYCDDYNKIQWLTQKEEYTLVFLTERQEILFEDNDCSLRITDKSLSMYIDEHNRYDEKITHFALASEFEAILPKGDL